MLAAKRIDEIECPSFSELFEAKKAYTDRTGQEVIDFSIGSSNIPPLQMIKDELSNACQDDMAYQYSLAPMDELVEAIQEWYKKRYGVDLEENEIYYLKGSQEALTHIPLAYCDPGDIVLIPDPYYPIYGTAPRLAGADVVFMPLTEENDYLIDFDAIDPEVAEKAKLMYVSYPSNPCGKKAPDWFYKKLIIFAKKYNILILHDNPYSELVFEGEPTGSFLAFDGAKDVGIELNSFSKSYSMGGARLAVLVGNKDMIDVYKKMIGMIDFGPFPAVQKAGIKALREGDGFVKDVRKEYKRRRDYLIDAFKKAGWDITPPEATMFVWARIPDHFKSSTDFKNALLEKAGVLVNPGSSFGEQGERYCRLALVRSDEEVDEAARRIKESDVLHQ